MNDKAPKQSKEEILKQGERLRDYLDTRFDPTQHVPVRETQVSTKTDVTPDYDENEDVKWIDAYCTNCHWHGLRTSLVRRKSEPDFPPRCCPKCKEESIEDFDAVMEGK